MEVNIIGYGFQPLKVSISDACYERCESYINEYRRYLMDCNVFNDDDFNHAHIEAGKIRSKLYSYLLALYDLGHMSYFDNAELRKHYGDRITVMYELWLEEKS